MARGKEKGVVNGGMGRFRPTHEAAGRARSGAAVGAALLTGTAASGEAALFTLSPALEQGMAWTVFSGLVMALIALVAALVLPRRLASREGNPAVSGATLEPEAQRDALLLASMTDGVVDMDEEGRILFINPAGARLLGYTPEELMGRMFCPVVLHLPEEGRPHALEECPVMWAIRHGKPMEELEGKFWRREGDVFHATYACTPLRAAGRIVGAALTFRDITNNLLFEQAMEAARERLDLALRGGDLGYWDMHVITGKGIVNERWLSLFGYTQGEVGEKVHEAWVQRLHPEDRERVLAIGASSQTGETREYAVEYRIVCPQGGVCWLYSRGMVAEWDDEGRAVRMVGTVQDISQRKLVEEKLATREQQFRMLLDSAPDAMVVTDGEGVIVMVNRRTEELFGYSREALVGREVEVLTPEVFRDAHRTQRHQYITQPEGRAMRPGRELMALTKDGREIPVEVSLNPIDTGEGLLVVSSLRDVSERKRNEILAREGMLLRQRITEVERFHRLTVDRERRILELKTQVNALANRLGETTPYAAPPSDNEGALLVSSDSLGGLTAFDNAAGPEATPSPTLYPGIEDLQLERAAAMSLAEDAEQARQTLARYQKELEHLVEVRTEELRRVNHGLEETRRELADQLAFTNVLVEIFPYPIFYKGADTRFLGCNRAYEETFAIHRQDFIGKRVLDLDYLPLEDRLAYQREDEEVIRTLGGVHKEMVIPFADGLNHHTLYWVKGFGKQNGEPGGLVGTFVDIQARKETERLMGEAKAAAEHATLAKSQFLANMSHEIRTPMNAIINLNRLVLGTDLTPRQRDYLEKLLRAGRNLLGIINDIMDFSKIEADKLEVERIPFELEETLAGVADLHGMKAEEKGLELVFQVDPLLPRRWMGDPLRLGQVLNNLLSNALKFTERGAVCLELSREEDSDGEPRLRVEVWDSGMGMSPEQLARLFQPFHQADGSITRRFGGAGLGLVISRRLVERMGGEMTVESVLGEGSRFAFSLPLVAAPTLGESSWEAPGGEGRRVLVVESHPLARRALVVMLSRLGWTVGEAASGGEAFSRLREGWGADGLPWHWMVVDGRLSDGDALAWIDAWQRHPEAPTMPRLALLVAPGHEEAWEAAHRAGLGGVLEKPATPARLRKVLADEARVGGVFPKPFSERVVQAKASVVPSAKGGRVLLVEDHDVNREIARELLEQAGWSVETARHGGEALAILERSAARDAAPFHLILMDLQMPEMDGFEATRRIRQDELWRETPIVAMTAHALLDEREKCLAAGMNGHLAKPIDLDELHRELQRWAPVVSEARGNPAATPAAGRTPPGLALPGVDTAAGLRRVGGDEAFYRDLLRRFAGHRQEYEERMALHLAQGQGVAARDLAHAIKGVAGNLGAMGLHQAAHELETALAGEGPALAGEGPAEAGVVATFFQELSRVMTVLQGVTPLEHPLHDLGKDVGSDASGAGVKPLLDPRKIRESLRRIDRELDLNLVEAHRLLEELSPQLRGTELHPLFAQLMKQAMAFDPDAARQTVGTLLERLGVSTPPPPAPTAAPSSAPSPQAASREGLAKRRRAGAAPSSSKEKK
ncbi:MAG: PAS domain S-box protein [Magnetococcales bacterium]|nr:PAS domain S-box protein [Magnetococcales bacterium]